MTTPAPSTANRRQKVDVEATHGWSDLPDGPLHTILMRLCSLVDLISFKSVCSSWRAVASSLPPSVITSLFPPLLLSPTWFNLYILSCRRLTGFGVFDPTSPSFFSSLSLDLDKLKYLGIVSYSHGHVLGFLHNRIVIINPFTGGVFYSPILPENHSNGMHHMQIQLTRFVLTAPLCSHHSGLLVFTSGPLLYWHIGSDSWSCHWPQTKITNDLRIVPVQGKVYAMNPRDYSLYVLDFSLELLLRPLTVDGLQQDGFFLDHFMVDCGGELMIIGLAENEDQLEENGDQLEENEDQLEENEEYFRYQLEVVVLDLSVNGPRWVKKETLGNWAIFVGCNRRVPGIAVENPEKWGGRSNCVYFATKNANGHSPWVAIKLGDRINTWDPESPLYIEYFEHQLSSAWVHPGC